MSTAGLVIADAWGMHGDVGTGWWIVMMLGMVLFWGAVALLIVWLARGGLESRASESVTATDILARRFAEGEITAEDYRVRREVLSDRVSATENLAEEEPKAAERDVRVKP